MYMNNFLLFLRSIFEIDSAFANPIPVGSDGVPMPLGLTPLAFLFALGFTTVIELIVVLLVSKIFLKQQKIGNIRLAFVAILASAITLPLLWYVFLPRGVNVLLLEGAVIVIEALLYRFLLPTRWTYALLLSLIANVLSFLASPMLAKLLVGTNPYL
jgi:hypothetical protein